MQAPPRTQPNERIYAIGDVHGRLDLLEALLARIADDAQGRELIPTRLIVLGDIIDRGPDSAEVVKRLMRYSKASPSFIVLKGNHEASMVAALGGDLTILPAWLSYGGQETLRSFGVPERLLASGASAHILHEARQVVGEEVLQWLAGRPLTFQSGDYLFVHAGLRPKVELGKQQSEDLLWIGEEFLHYEHPHPFVVVHGHHIEEHGPVIRDNRIGLDTGAYATGRLSAIGLEGSERWVLTT